MAQKRKINWIAIVLGAIIALVLGFTVANNTNATFGELSVRQVGYLLIGTFGAISAIFWIFAKKTKKEVLHSSEKEFLGSLTAFSALVTFIGVPVVQAFAMFFN